jgi:arylsulfatase A-like enzyme
MRSSHIRAALIASLCLLVLAAPSTAAPGAGAPAGVAPRLADAPSAKPNVVLFLLDDTNPMDGRLWNNPALTPTLYNMFVAHGITFSNAVDDTPLCCPSRGTLLTGLHSFNHGVTVNDVNLFHPSESIATELGGKGYATMLIGKYMNHTERLTSSQYAKHAAPWSVFDIFTSPFSDDEGFFYDYEVTEKDGTVLYPDEHSTQWVTNTAVSAMAATDPDKPLFAYLSIVDTHRPAMPMPQFKDDTRCDSMPPWNPPNYNEADVSDKPGYVRNTKLLKYPDGWPVVSYCKEMLGVDWMVNQVVTELQNEGRFDNTMFVFMGDNGMSWGQHRQQLKETPYAVRIPLMISWPARWGTAPRTIDEYISNIDFAPTVCDLAGCQLGPFPTGQSHADGLSWLPLLDGTVPNMGRDALVETEWRIHPWAAVQTTQLSPLGLWHYVEYKSGFKELYDVAPGHDPWELDNLASNPAYNSLMATLHDRLIQLLSEGRQNQPASLTVIEDSDPNAGQDFTFTGDLGTFRLDDDSNNTLPRKKVLSNLKSGTYELSQLAAPGWTLKSINCQQPSETNATTGSATVTLLPGTATSCTFTNVRRRPDLSIANAVSGRYKGDNAYSAVPVKKQTQKHLSAVPGGQYQFFVTIQNDSNLADSFALSADVTASTPGAMAATFWANGTDVTTAIMSGTYRTGNLAKAATMSLEIRVSVDPLAAVGDRQTILLRVTSDAAPAAVDLVRAITKV